MASLRGILEKEREYYKSITLIYDTELGRLLFGTTDILNSKISGLLTHISIMMAILGFFLADNQNSHKIITLMVAGEMVLYLILAIGCLLGLYITNPLTLQGHENAAADRLTLILRRRRRIYLFSLKGTIAVTIAFFATLLCKMYLQQ